MLVFFCSSLLALCGPVDCESVFSQLANAVGHLCPCPPCRKCLILGAWNISAHFKRGTWKCQYQKGSLKNNVRGCIIIYEVEA